MQIVAQWISTKGVYLHFPKILMRFVIGLFNVGFIPHAYWYTMIYHPKNKNYPFSGQFSFLSHRPVRSFKRPHPSTPLMDAWNSPATSRLGVPFHRAPGLWSKNHWKTHQLWRLSPTWLAILLGLGSWKICSKPLYLPLEVMKVITKVARRNLAKGFKERSESCGPACWSFNQGSLAPRSRGATANVLHICCWYLDTS